MAEQKIEKGMLVKVEGATVYITTMNQCGRFYERDKRIFPGRPIFGTVEGIYEIKREKWEPVRDEDGNLTYDEDDNVVKELAEPAKLEALIEWDGPRYRTSMLPLEMLTPANQKR